MPPTLTTPRAGALVGTHVTALMACMVATMTLPVPLKLSRIAVPYAASIVHDPAGEVRQVLQGTVLPGEQAAEAVIILWSCALVAGLEKGPGNMPNRFMFQVLDSAVHVSDAQIKILSVLARAHTIIKPHSPQNN
ncbi:hypothetical protein SRHO_G00331330 [Serrasalmus rhombeus]